MKTYRLTPSRHWLLTTLPTILATILNVSLVAQDEQSDDEVFELSPFTVTSSLDRGYGASSSLGATRVALPHTDISSAIVTLSEELIQDTAATDAKEFLQYASGVQIASDQNPGQIFYSLRGYALSGISIRDGLPDRFTTADIPLDENTAYQRLEVIKGPAGTLYGSHSMGGIVNKISKWALTENFTETQLQVASGHEKFIRGVVDANRSIGDSSAIRAVLSYRDGERHIDESDSPNDMLNFTLMGAHYFKESGGKIWGRFQYLDYELDREQGWQYLTGYLTPGGSAPEVTNQVFAISRHANIVPEDDISKGTMRAYELGYEKPFNTSNGNWTFRLVARSNSGKGDKSPSYSQGRPVAVDGNGELIGDNRFVSALDPRVSDWRTSLTLRDFRGFRENDGLFMDLNGKFDALGVEHDFILNANYGQSQQERAFFFWPVQNPDDPTSIGNTFSATRPNFSGINAQTIVQNNEKRFNRFQGFSESDGFSIGFQDNVKLMEGKLILVGGARYDDSSTDAVRFDVEESIAQDRFVRDESSWSSNAANDTTYKVGIVAKPTEGLSFFAQNATTFNAVSSVDPQTGNKFPNQEGEIIEVGTKLSMNGNRLVATLSWFDMELTNVIIQVPLPISEGGGTVPRAVGVQATDGIELDLAWQPTDNLSLLFAASDLDSTDANGRFFRGVPMKFNYSLFGKYSFNEGLLSGYHVGLGFKHNAMAPGDSGNSFFLSDTDILDLFAGYSQENWSVQLNVYNVNGEDGILSSVIDRLAMRAPDTNYRLTARFRF